MNATATKTAPTFDTAFFKHLPSLTGWAIAELYGLHYEGDSDPITHGGTFYNLNNWQEYGYAGCVELYPNVDGTDVMIVSVGTVHRPDDTTLARALHSADLPPDTTEPAELAYAVRCYCGAEPDDEPGRTYDTANWPNEWRLWKSIHPLLLALANQ